MMNAPSASTQSSEQTNYRRIVVKAGTTLLTDSAGGLDLETMEALVRQDGPAPSRRRRRDLRHGRGRWRPGATCSTRSRTVKTFHSDKSLRRPVRAA